MYFLHQGFWKLSSDRHTDRQTESTEIINDAALRMVNKTQKTFIMEFEEV